MHVHVTDPTRARPDSPAPPRALRLRRHREPAIDRDWPYHSRTHPERTAELDSVAAVGREFGVGWECADQAVVDSGDVLIEADDRLERTRQLGIDEHRSDSGFARIRPDG
jgi:hypothetical protein